MRSSTALPGFVRGLKRQDTSWPRLFVGRVPGLISLKLCHCLRERGSVRAKILFIDHVFVRDDEGHHTRRSILRGISDESEATRAISIIWTRSEGTKIIT